MARLYLFAEGQTEQTFADIVLCPHLANFGVYLTNIILIAHARKKGKVHRGGGRAYQPMRDDIERMMRSDNSADVYFTTMIDLYAIPAEFPGRAEAEKLRSTPEKRVEALEQAFAEDMDDTRFIPYLQLHEYEAILFAEPAKFRILYPQHEAAIAKIEAIADTFATPEAINDGPETAPSKRLIAALPAYNGAKPIAGPLIAEAIGLATIRARCPHFHTWLSHLENLGATVSP